MIRPLRPALRLLGRYRRAIEQARRRRLARHQTTLRLPEARAHQHRLAAERAERAEHSVRATVQRLRAEGERLVRDAERTLAGREYLPTTRGAILSSYGIEPIPPDILPYWRRSWRAMGSRVRPKARLSREDMLKLWLAYRADAGTLAARVHGGHDWYRDLHPDTYHRAMHDVEIARQARSLLGRGVAQARRDLARGWQLLRRADRLERDLDPLGRYQRLERELARALERGEPLDEDLLREHTALARRLKRGCHGRLLQRAR